MKRLMILLAVILLSGCTWVVQATPAEYAEWQARYHPEITAPDIVPSEETGELVPDPTPLPPCDLIVKGNVSTRAPHEKIYFVPGDPNYDQVKISEARGEAFFCDAASAEAAGFRPYAR